MKDTLPNVATVVMGIKDKISGGNEFNPIWSNPEWASPQTVEAFFHQRIGGLKQTVEMQKLSDQSTFEADFEIHQCQKSRNIVNAIRLNGPTALISQSDRHYAATIAANIITSPTTDESGNYSEPKAKENDRVKMLIAASLGHKNAIKILEKQKEEAKQQ